MAISGSFYGKTGNSAIKPKITWEAVANEAGNYSDLTATLTYSRKDNYSTYGHWAGSLTIDGKTQTRSGHYMVITKDSETVAITYTVRVQHNDNGSRKVTISAAGSISETTLTYTSISAEVTLEDIPRAASIAASDGDIGSTVMVTIGKKSEQHRYLVAYTFGQLHGFLTENGLTEQGEYTRSACLAFPISEVFYDQIPDVPAGLCTLTCTTFLDDTQISTPQQATFTVRANPDRCGPLVAGTVTDSNPQTLALTGDENRLVRGESTALCRMDAQSRCAAALQQRKIMDREVTDDRLEIPNIADSCIRFLARDSRGYSTQTLVERPMIPYFPPVVRLQVSRTDPVSGNGTLTVRGSFYNDSFGAVRNHLQLRWRVNDGQWQELQPTVEGNDFTASAGIFGMDYTCSHRITLEVTDALHCVTAAGDIQPGIPVFDWGARDFAFHVPVSMNGQTITGVGEPVGDGDAVNKAYVDSRAPGVTAPVNGFFTLSVDENGDLWAHSSGDGTVPEFVYDSSTGDLYFITE